MHSEYYKVSSKVSCSHCSCYCCVCVLDSETIDEGVDQSDYKYNHLMKDWWQIWSPNDRVMTNAITWWSEWLQIWSLNDRVITNAWSPNDRAMTNTITWWSEWLQVWSPNDRVITNMITWSYEGLPNCAVCAIHNLQGDFCDLVVIVKTTKNLITKMMLFKILALLWLSSSFTLSIAIRKKRRPTITWKWNDKN